jgi:cytochrome c
MMPTWLILKAASIATLLFFWASTGHASTNNAKAFAIAKQNACLGCHAVNKKIVGPSFQDIALKYRNNPSANTFLKNKIQKGGAGSWGVVPMPANTKLSDAELSILLPWILQGAPESN